MSATAKTDAALLELGRLLGGELVHVNHGESEDYMRGFNDGYDDRFIGYVRDRSDSIPDHHPWREAYLRGYDEGLAWRDEDEEE